MTIAVAQRNTQSFSASSTFSVPLPSTSAVTGDFYIIFVEAGSSATMSTSSTGWTQISWGTGQRLSAFYGYQGVVGALSVAISAGTDGASAGFRVTGSVPSLGIKNASVTGSALPYTNATLTTGFGPRECLWIIANATASTGGPAPTGAPSGFSNFQAAGGASNLSSIATADMIAIANSESPGSWTGPTFAQGWVDATVAIAGYLPDPNRSQFATMQRANLR